MGVAGHLLVVALVLLVWLAGRYEASQVQVRLERDATEAVSDIRAALTRNVQSLQALANGANSSSGAWAQEATTILREHREMVRIEWRDAQLSVRWQRPTRPTKNPYLPSWPAAATQSEVQLACGLARRLSGPAYSSSHFVPQPDGLGLELIEMCMPLSSAGQTSGYLVATYALQSMLTELMGKQITRGQEVSFTEADGTRLAIYGTTLRGSRVFTAQQLLDLPGNTLVVRMDSWRGAPDLFPNVLDRLGYPDGGGIGVCAGVTGQRHQQAFACRTRTGRGIGFSQSHGGLLGDRHACARPARPHYLCEPCACAK